MEVSNSFSQSEENFHKMVDFLVDEESKLLDLSGLEEFLFQGGRDLCRQLLRDHLAQRGFGDVGSFVVGSDGIKRTHKRLLTKTIITLFGPIEITRYSYSNSCVSSLFPLDGMLNLPPIKLSYTLQKHFVLEVIDNSFQKSCERMTRWTGVTISKREAESIIVHASKEFTTFYEMRVIQERDKAQKCPLLIVTSDGKGVFVKIEDLRAATRKKAQRHTRSNRDRISQKKHKYSKRVATVASVYEIERYIRQVSDIAHEFFSTDSASHTKAFRPRPCAKRVWAGLKDPGKSVVETIFQEALRRDVHRVKEWVVLVDGDLNQLKQFQRLSEKFGVSPTLICDCIHVLRYLWKAGNALQSKEKNVAEWVYEKFTNILHGNSRRVAAGMRRWATRRHLKKSIREPVDNCARYLVNHAPYLHYDEYLKKGYPIATGVIEGTCRYLVKDRMELTGARWGLTGAEAVLKLRAIKTSGDFNEYWKFYENKQFDNNHKNLYENPYILKSKKTTGTPL
jgi:hypothetical protein